MAGAKKTTTNVLVVTGVVLALFAIVLVKSLPASREAVPNRSAGAGSSLTSVRNDAVADYEAALKAGKPVFVLFHSLS